MTKLKNKVAVVTGAASGVGAATARLFVEEGAKAVIVADINDAGTDIASDIGPAASFIKTDVSDPAQVQAMIDGTVARFGRIDVLHNNAFYNKHARFDEMPLEVWNQVLGVTLNGVFYGMRFALPHMLRQGGGVIVNTASTSGLGGDHRIAAYNAAKAGVINLTRSVAIDYARLNIRANVVCPGPIASPPMRRFLDGAPDPAMAWREANNRTPMNRMADSVEIARAVLFLACDDSSFMTGSAITVDGGLMARTGMFGAPLEHIDLT